MLVGNDNNNVIIEIERSAKHNQCAANELRRMTIKYADDNCFSIHLIDVIRNYPICIKEVTRRFFHASLFGSRHRRDHVADDLPLLEK